MPAPTHGFAPGGVDIHVVRDSMDDRAKSEFTYTEAVPLVMQLIIHFPAVRVASW